MFLLFFKQSGRGFFTIQAVLLTGAAILCAVFFSTGRSVGEKDGAALEARRRAEDCADRLKALEGRYPEAAFSRALGNLAEKLRCADGSASASADAEIESVLLSLETELAQSGDGRSDAAVNELCRELNSLIAKRQSDINQAKRGGI